VPLEVRTYKWYVTNHLVMIHVSVKFYEILFNCSEVVVWTRKKAYFTFDIY